MPQLGIAVEAWQAFQLELCVIMASPQQILKYTQKLGTEPSTNAKLFCMRLKYWWTVQLGLCIASIAFILGALGAPVWVVQGEDEAKFEGALLYCSDCIDEIDGDYYGEILDDDICDGSLFDGFCDMVEDLRTAGAVYLTFSILTLLCVGLWIAKIVMCLLEKSFLPRIVTLSIPPTTVLFNLIALASWGGITQAKYDGSDCDDFSAIDAEDLCVGPGASLALFILLYLSVIAALFEVIFVLREGKAEFIDSTNQI